ncbi:MAG: hypothetical protein V1839_03250 [archaeon]
MAIKIKNLKVTDWAIGGKIGHWLFLAGIAVSVVLGIFLPENLRVASILVLLGILVGFLNITSDEVNSFLLAAVALIISAQFMQAVPLAGTTIINMLKYIVYFVEPAALIVSLIAVWKLASKR